MEPDGDRGDRRRPDRGLDPGHGRGPERVLDPVPDRDRGGGSTFRDHRDGGRGRRTRDPADDDARSERHPVDVSALPADAPAGRGLRGRHALAPAHGPAPEAIRDGGDRGILGSSARQGTRRGGAPAQGGSGADRVRRRRRSRAQDPARGDPRCAEHPQAARCGARRRRPRRADRRGGGAGRTSHPARRGPAHRLADPGRCPAPVDGARRPSRPDRRRGGRLQHRRAAAARDRHARTRGVRRGRDGSGAHEPARQCEEVLARRGADRRRRLERRTARVVRDPRRGPRGRGGRSRGDLRTVPPGRRLECAGRGARSVHLARAGSSPWWRARGGRCRRGRRPVHLLVAGAGPRRARGDDRRVGRHRGERSGCRGRSASM